MFSFEWRELETVLEDLAATPAQRDRVRSFVGGIAKQSTRCSSTETLLLIATAAHLVQRQDYEDALQEAGELSRLH